MGFFDGWFGSSPSEPQQSSPKKSTGLLSNLDPETMGLLSMSAAMMQAGGPSTKPISFGQGLGYGIQNYLSTYNSALDHQTKREDQEELRTYRKMQGEQLGMKTAAMKSQQAAIANLKTKMEADPSYKPTTAELMEIDADAAFKQLGGGAVDFGLEPKVGVNPTTNKPGYFIQGKNGNTKWLDAGVPDNFRLVPGNDYQGPQTFDPRTGSVAPINAGRPSAPGAAPGITPGGGPAPIAPQGPVGSPPPVAGAVQLDPSLQGDPFAPWNHITSPKEVDQFKQRSYEQDNRRLDDMRKQIAQGRQVMGRLERFGELNRTTDTGSWLDQIDAAPTFDAAKKEMQAITSDVGPQQRQEGSGSSSDRDMGLYLKSVPGIDKTGDVNRNIRLEYEKQLKAGEDRYRFMESYLTNRGHLNGADEAYERKQDAAKGKPNGLDISKLTPQQQAYLQQQNPEAFANGAANFARTTNQANKPKTKAIKLDGGGSAFANLGPDGNYYVERNGKRYRVED